ncbi:D-TA family PLP-dependent enzyme [Sphingobacterium sp. UT-1RO-CII-1]|uniref:D-TA family PLP-dependent enzyme n=1 Tax=Sphingobacterium sp. UT-1RO-CII-1 TaxID=2995225 RepID=UPI00227D1302|nr:D-TA family PLP-dependent enzyme [Sphingobacterium sp. UT-1RO-CII-1]MCY4779166.1 D-TA family PLP-dependent enzyme [Sphingobacterium sp. UT-1RO-CII-1]
MLKWYQLADVSSIESPTLLLYPERIRKNIQLLIDMVEGQCERLRPHVKTNKMVEVCKMMIEEGITQFKCSTIAEAEMLGLSGAGDVLLAYQPVATNISRWVKLIESYPNTHFSCLVDNTRSVEELSVYAEDKGIKISVYLDIDVGMGRTGTPFSEVPKLKKILSEKEMLILEGVHGYDGHISNPVLAIRQEESDLSYKILKKAYNYLQGQTKDELKMVLGGSPSFSFHRHRPDVVCSPGTFVFWDWGYRERIAEQPFEYAAVLMTRVISIISDTRICVDLGYKAVASDPPLPRVFFLDDKDLKVVLQSEEHLLLSVPDSSKYPIGRELYAVPTHICPTVNLYDKVNVIGEHCVIDSWEVIARKRKINI